MTDPLLVVDDLHTHFRTDNGLVKAVDGLSFSVKRGETVGLVGESGSGKSVASLSVMGLIPQPPGFHPQGAIKFEGQSILNASNETLRPLRGNRMAMIFQDPMTSLNPYLTVERQLTEVLELHRGVDRATARRQAVVMLEKVGIPEADRRIAAYPHEFSGGMRQRVMIAMALLCEPDLLIADEPTTALDVTIQAQILDLIRDLQRDAGTAVILITHDLGVVAGMADQVCVMYAGRIVERGSAEALFSRSRHPYTQGLLRSVPRLDDPERRPLVPIPGLPPDLSSLPGGCAFHPRCERRVERCEHEYPSATDWGAHQSAHCWNPEEA